MALPKGQERDEALVRMKDLQEQRKAIEEKLEVEYGLLYDGDGGGISLPKMGGGNKQP